MKKFPVSGCVCPVICGIDVRVSPGVMFRVQQFTVLHAVPGQTLQSLM